MARHGARSLSSQDEPTTTRRPVRRRDERPAPSGTRRPPRPTEEWIDEGPAKPKNRPPQPADRVKRRRETALPNLPDPITRELSRALPPSKTGKMAKRLVDAAKAFEDDRPQDTYRLLRPLLAESPEIPTVRELAGLALYRQGKWKRAALELEEFRRLTGSYEQHPVLADCYRALKRYKKVDELWGELREASPGLAILTEGRIVTAGAMADRGNLTGAIALLERGPVAPRRSPTEYHLRLWYALADLYERSGDTSRARELFRRVLEVEPDLADTAERLASLG